MQLGVPIPTVIAAVTERNISAQKKKRTKNHATYSATNNQQTDPALADLSREKRIEWCREMDERSRADKLVITAENRVTDSHSIGARATSNGFEAVEQGTGVWLFAEVSVPDGEKRPEDYYYAGGSHLSDLPSALSIADEALRFTKECCGDSLKLIGVGGIMNAQDAKRKMELGADLVQIYSGWVYGGPEFVPQLLNGLSSS